MSLKTKTISALPYVGASLVCLAFTDVALAAKIGQLAENVQSNFSAMEKLLKGVSYLGGVGFGLGAALKFKEHNENPTQTKLSKPITMALVSGALLALPQLMTTSVETVWNNPNMTNSSGA